MTFMTKVEQLRDIIDKNLLPIIGKKAVLVDAPYYDNVGDVLIWQGIQDFLKSNGIKLLYTTSGDTFTFPPIDPDVTILLMGGGNFGDLWRWFQDIRIKVIESYPGNRIVMFPQSIWYEDENTISKDYEIFKKHPNLYLCARDKWSYDFLNTHFSDCKILLVPDMAFYISDEVLSQYRNIGKNRHLFLRRLDKEITSSTPDELDRNSEIHDWPTIEFKDQRFATYRNLLNWKWRFRKIPLLRKLVLHSIDRWADRNIRKSMVKEGCAFLSSYQDLTSTRLHALILGVLLYKPVQYIDNTTGKLSAFAQTWLNDLSEVRKYE